MPMTEIEITNILNTKTAFAVTSGPRRESVFIPGRVAELCSLYVGQRVEAMLVPNTTQPEKTPWLAQYISQDTVLIGMLEQDIRDDLARGPATATQVARSIGQPVDLVARKMRAMCVGLNALVRDEIFALSMEDLLAEEE
jgi:hypothetical protein